MSRPGLRQFAALLLFACSLAWAEVPVPALHARVTDLTGTLTAAQSAALESRLAAFEREKGSQVAVLIVPTTQPETIEQYAIRVAGVWKLGRKGVDDGALLLIAKNDRRMRIEVGYGLEGAMPDAIAKRIITETITPYFKQGDFYAGINAGVEQMLRVIQGEALPPPARRAAAPQGNALGALLVPFLILFVVVGRLLRGLIGIFPSSALVGAGTGVAASFITGSALLAVGAGIIAVLVALILMSGAVGVPYYAGRGGGLGGGGGFGGGGGGFGGGGGGFGGGGASGSW